jgi:taurine dioxygenase
VIVTPMPGHFGACIEDVDVRAIDQPMAAALGRALYRHRILLIPDQQANNDEYVRFGRWWGEPISFFSPGDRHAEHPELIRVTNSPRTPEPLRDGAMHWHSDSSYEAVPASVTMLYAQAAPAGGNDTLFADTIAAYAALDSELQHRIEGLEVVHDPKGGRVDFAGEVRGDSSATTLPCVQHPLVRSHPVTGERGLFGFSGTAVGIVGMEETGAIELLLELKRHALQSQFQQRARAITGSILLWDNYAVVHSATPTHYSDREGERRLLYRISTRGIPRAMEPIRSGSG